MFDEAHSTDTVAALLCSIFKSMIEHARSGADDEFAIPGTRSWRQLAERVDPAALDTVAADLGYRFARRSDMMSLYTDARRWRQLRGSVKELLS